MNYGYHDNVVFDIYAATYSSTVRMNVINDAPDATNLHGHIQDILQSIQGLRESVNAADKTIKYKLVVRSNPDTDAFLAEGRIVRVTKVRNRNTRAWLSLETVRNYRISKINNLDANGNYLVLSLQDQGADATRI